MTFDERLQRVVAQLARAEDLVSRARDDLAMLLEERAECRNRNDGGGDGTVERRARCPLPKQRTGQADSILKSIIIRGVGSILISWDASNRQAEVLMEGYSVFRLPLKLGLTLMCLAAEDIAETSDHLVGFKDRSILMREVGVKNTHAIDNLICRLRQKLPNAMLLETRSNPMRHRIVLRRDGCLIVNRAKDPREIATMRDECADRVDPGVRYPCDHRDPV